MKIILNKKIILLFASIIFVSFFAKIVFAFYNPGDTLNPTCMPTDPGCDVVISPMSIGGNITGATAGSILFVDPSGILAQDNTNFFWDPANHQLQVGPSAGFDGNSQIQLSLSNDINSFSGVYNQNKNAGDAASTDFLVGADNDGVALTGHFGDFGIQGSGFSPIANPSFNGFLADDIYLYGSGGNMIIGTDGGVPGKVIKFFVGGLTTVDQMATITTTGLGVGTVSPGSKLDVKGTLRLSGSSSGFVGFAPQSAAGSVTYTLPNADGTNNFVLTTDGGGNLSWSSKTGGVPGSISSINGDSSAAQTITSGAGLNINNSGATHTFSVDFAYAPTWTGVHTFSNSVHSALFTGGSIGMGTITPSGYLSVTPPQYSTGTASQTLTTITGTGTTFTSAMVGSQLVFANGVSAGTITAFNSPTSLTVSTSQTVTNQAYIISYTGLQVANNGNIGIGTTSPGARLDSLSTTEQLRLSYDSTHFASFTTGSGGDITIAAGGTNQNAVLSASTNHSTGAGRAIIFGGSNVAGGTILSVRRTGEATDTFTVSNTGATLVTGTFQTQGVLASNLSLFDGSLKLPRDKVITWSSDPANYSIGVDTGLARSAAGVLKVTNGSSGDGSLFVGGSVGIGAAATTYKLEIAPTTGATAGQTVFIQDATATTGATTLLIKGGAGQASTDLTQWRTSANSLVAEVTASGSIIGALFVDNNNVTAVRNTGVTIGSAGTIAWSSTTAQNASNDTGIARSSANNISITNASSTTYWTLGGAGIQAGTDNTLDIGASGATRPRTLYLGTSLITANGSAAAPSISFASETTLGFYRSSVAGNVVLATATADRIRFGADLTFQPTTVLQWGSSGFTSPDLRLTRNGSGKLNLDNGSVGVGLDFATTNVLKVRTLAQSADASLTALNLTASGTTTSPVLIGGTGTTQTLALRPTSGAGTTGADIIFQIGNNGATEAMRILNSGNVKIAGTAVRGTTEGTNHLDIFDGTAPVGTLTNGISIYSSAGEGFMMDAAGNATLQTPHENEHNYWVFDSHNTQTGKRLLVDMELMMKNLNSTFGWDYVHETIDGVVLPDPNAPLALPDTFWNAIANKLTSWLADAGNGIAKIFTKEVTTETLCVSDASGAKTCINKSQLDALISGAGQAGGNNSNNGNVGGSGSPNPTPPPGEAAPDSNPPPSGDSPSTPPPTYNSGGDTGTLPLTEVIP